MRASSRVQRPKARDYQVTKYTIQLVVCGALGTEVVGVTSSEGFLVNDIMHWYCRVFCEACPSSASN